MSQETSIWTILLTTGVVSSLIAAIGSLYIGVANNRHLKRLERVKKSLESGSLRFERLAKMHDECRKIESFSPQELIGAFQDAEGDKAAAVLKKIIDSATTVKNLYVKYKIYFDDDLAAKVDVAIGVVASTQDQMTRAGLTSSTDLGSVEVARESKRYLEGALAFRGVLDEALEEQLKRLRGKIF